MFQVLDFLVGHVDRNLLLIILRNFFQIFSGLGCPLWIFLFQNHVSISLSRSSLDVTLPSRASSTDFRTSAIISSCEWITQGRGVLLLEKIFLAARSSSSDISMSSILLRYLSTKLSLHCCNSIVVISISLLYIYAPKVCILYGIKKKERYTSQHPLLINTKQSTKNYCLNKTI